MTWKVPTLGVKFQHLLLKRYDQTYHYQPWRLLFEVSVTFRFQAVCSQQALHCTSVICHGLSLAPKRPGSTRPLERSFSVIGCILRTSFLYLKAFLFSVSMLTIIVVWSLSGAEVNFRHTPFDPMPENDRYDPTEQRRQSKLTLGHCDR